MQQGRHLEWARLQLEGHSVITGAAIGSSQLLWVACRASPCLVHVFQDSKLLLIYRFSTDPVFLLFGRQEIKQDTATSTGIGTSAEVSLLSITKDGRIWLLPISLDVAPLSARPVKKRKEADTSALQIPVKEVSIDRGSGEPAASLNKAKIKEWDIFKDIDVYETKHAQAPGRDAPRRGKVESRSKGHEEAHTDRLGGEIDYTVGDDLGIPGLSLRLARLPVLTHGRDHLSKVKLVLHSALVGILPDASVAGFGPSSSVAVLAPFGVARVFSLNGSCSSQNLFAATTGIAVADKVPSEFGTKPTCLLFVSLMGDSQISRPTVAHAVLHRTLFDAILIEHPKGAWRNIWLQGDMDGRVYVVTLLESKPEKSFSVLLDLQQPVVELLVVPARSSTVHKQGLPESQELQEGDSLLVVGQQGRVILIKGVNEPSGESPFLPSRKVPSWAIEQHNPTRTVFSCANLVVHEWKLESPILSACMVGPHRLCYCARSQVLYADLLDIMGLPSIYSGLSVITTAGKVPPGRHHTFETGSISEKLMSNPKRSKQDWTFRDELVSRIIPIAYLVVGIAGKGFAGGLGSTRPLVALTAQGRIICVEVSEHISDPVFKFENSIQKCSGTLQLSLEEKVKELVQTVAKGAQSTELVKAHSDSITLALSELATTLPLVNNISSDQSRLCIYYPKPSSSGDFPMGKIWCTLAVTPHPVVAIFTEKLSFGPRSSTNSSSYHVNPPYMVSISLNLCNNSPHMLSPYWSLLLELRSLSPDSSPPIVHSSIVINNGLGLPVGAHFSHDFDLELPGTTWGPVISSLYLCHVHDYHYSITDLNPSKDAFPNLYCNPHVTKDLSCKKTSIEKNILDSKDNTGSPKSGSVCVLLSKYRIDLFSLLKPPAPQIGKSPWAYHSLDHVPDGISGDDYDLVGPFSGNFRLLLEEVEQSVGTRDHKELWGKLHLEDLLLKGAILKAGRKLIFSGPDGGVLSISLETGHVGKNAVAVSVLFEASCLLLGSLAREALCWRLSKCSLVEADSNTKVEHSIGTSTKMPRAEYSGKSARSTTNPNVAAETEEEHKLSSTGKGYVEGLVTRVRTINNVWKAVFTSKNSERVGPLLDDTYSVIQALIKVYRDHREDRSSNPFYATV